MSESLDERLARIKRGAMVAEDVTWLVAQVEILSQRRLAQWEIEREAAIEGLIDERDSLRAHVKGLSQALDYSLGENRRLQGLLTEADSAAWLLLDAPEATP